MHTNNYFKNKPLKYLFDKIDDCILGGGITLMATEYGRPAGNKHCFKIKARYSNK